VRKKSNRAGNPGKIESKILAREIVCGFHAVSSAIRRAPDTVIQLWIDSSRHDSRVTKLTVEAQQAGVNTISTDKSNLDQKSGGQRHQGVLAEIRSSEYQDESALYRRLELHEHQPLLLVLDQVQDPHNLGACLRTAEGAGVDAVVLPKDGAAPVNQTVRRVAAGAADRIPVYYVTNLSRCLESLKKMGVWITGAAEEGDSDLYDLHFNGSTAIVMGAEGKGLRRLTREHCDQIVRIPMAGAVSSLNVSVATGVILFEVVRQRQCSAK